MISNAFACLGIIGLAVFYVFQISDTTSRGFALLDLEKNVEALRFENQKLMAEAASIKRLPSVAERMQMLGLSAPMKTIYLSGTDSLARR